jgi:aspartyl-tRNA(Asn)/glutamyl-tRNA(Gln) amidotransferase subunit A
VDIIKETCINLVQAVRNKEISAKEVVSAFCARIKDLNPKLNAVLWFDESEALLRAEEIDKKAAQGGELGTLAGIPVVVKDNICVKDRPTTCASRILESYLPPYSSFVADRILEEDGIIIGKANMDEFAMGSSTENSAFGPVINPRCTNHVPGGSSGGSAVAVAAGFSPVSLGSDTGGSIRQPASHTGVVGLKPTYGRVSRYGLVAFGSSLDQIGPFARNVKDIKLMMNVISGHDPRDGTHTSLEPVAPDLQERGDLENLKIGIPKEYIVEGIDQSVISLFDQARSIAEEQGAELIDISIPHTEYGVAIYYIIACAEASSNLARYDGAHYGYRAEAYEDLISMFSNSRRDGFGPEVKRRIILGTHVLSSGYYDAYYNKALKVRGLLKQDFLNAFNECDLIMCPVAPTPPFKLGEFVDNPLEMYLSDIFTISANLAGVPAISVPAGLSADGLPVGIQFAGPHFSEENLLECAAVYEGCRDFEVDIAEPGTDG